jgi:hypothetical protein
VTRCRRRQHAPSTLHRARAIATAFGIGERTAETDVSNIMNELGINRRQEIAAWARECGLAERADRTPGRNSP